MVMSTDGDAAGQAEKLGTTDTMHVFLLVSLGYRITLCRRQQALPQALPEGRGSAGPAGNTSSPLASPHGQNGDTEGVRNKKWHQVMWQRWTLRQKIKRGALLQLLLLVILQVEQDLISPCS